MRKFNTSDLFTGYLKQLLREFNLPKIKVYSKKYSDYYNKNKTESPEILSSEPYNEEASTTLNVRYFPYIREGKIQEYINNNWHTIGDYISSAPKYYAYNQKILNYTKNLQINSNVYDSYTHEYLGDYLRFHRDFTGVNLMPLYNCFSNRACEKLNLKWSLPETRTTISFNSEDLNYKIYMVPVKLFQEYTIAIDSEYPIELCCGIYGDYQNNNEKFLNIPQLTYKKFSSSKFSHPILYQSLLYSDDNDETTTLFEAINNDQATKIELAQNECDLKLFIKVPKNNNSTIVILEGNYVSWNDAGNHSVINIDGFTKDPDLKLITNLQLLRFNTKHQHPFADRLIEYLIGNAITGAEDEIYDNIRRAQKALKYNTASNNFEIEVPGIWSSDMRTLFYEYMTTHNKSFEVNHDILGYVDKDVEKYYIARINKGSHVELVSLSNIELEEGDK